MKIDTSITKMSYVLKRLRDSGYKADKFIGYTDTNSLEKSFKKELSEVFPKGDVYNTETIYKNLRHFSGKLNKYFQKIPSYDEVDQREWTILIDGGGDNIQLTLYRNVNAFGDDYFELFDGGQNLKPTRLKVGTLSFESLMEELNSHGVVNKLDFGKALK